MNSHLIQLLLIVVFGYAPAAVTVFFLTISDFKLCNELNEEKLRQGFDIDHSFTKAALVFIAHIFIPGWNILAALLLMLFFVVNTIVGWVVPDPKPLHFPRREKTPH